MSQDFEHELSVAVDAVRLASSLCRLVQSEIAPDALEKKDRSPVTVADFASQAVICRFLRDTFPDDPIVAEEDSAYLREPQNGAVLDQVVQQVRASSPDAGQDDVCRWIDEGNAQEYHDRFWTLDPIDGTKGFLRKQQYAISLALILDGRITVGAMACPNLSLHPDNAAPAGIVFAAVRGRGATAAPIDGNNAPVPVRVSQVSDPADARLCESVESAHTSHGHSHAIAERLGIARESVRLDSQAKYGIVARGEAEVYLRLPTRKDYTEKIWDHAGGVSIVTEAGGTVTDVSGKELDFTLGPELIENRGVIVTNGRLHDRVLAAVGAVL